MAIKKINYNFFQITPKRNTASSPQEIQGELNNLVKITDFPTQHLTDRVLFMHEFKQSDTCFLGTLVLTQMNNLNGRVDYESKKISPLSLGTTEGLERHGTFLIDPRANILVIENGGISSSMVLNYLSYVSPMPKAEASLLINPSELQKFYNMHVITKFSVKIAKVETGSIFQNNNTDNLSISQVTESADDTNTDELDYTLKVSKSKNHENKSLNKSKIVNFVKEFLRFKETHEIKELKVTGEYNDHEGNNRIVPLDLIEERLHDFIEIEKDNRNSTVFKIPEKYRLLELMYNRHKHSVITTYALKE